MFLRQCELLKFGLTSANTLKTLNKKTDLRNPQMHPTEWGSGQLMMFSLCQNVMSLAPLQSVLLLSLKLLCPLYPVL